MNVIYVCPRQNGKINEVPASLSTHRVLPAASSFLLEGISISQGRIALRHDSVATRTPGRDDLRKSDPRLLHRPLLPVIAVFALPSLFALVRCAANLSVLFWPFSHTLLACQVTSFNMFTCINL